MLSKKTADRTSRSRRSAVAREVSVIMPRIAQNLTSGFVHSLDLPPAQLFTILDLQESNGCRINDLSRRFRVSAPTMTGIVDRLEKGKYVKRVPDAQDRRAVNVVLTAKGLAAAKKIRKNIHQRWMVFLEKIPLPDCDKFLTIIRTIEQNVSEKQP